MNGQWIGKTEGTNPGTIVLNADEFPSFFQGVAYHTNDGSTMPNTAVFFKTENKDKKFKIHSKVIHPIDPNTGLVTTLEKVKQYLAPDDKFPTCVDVVGTWGEESLELSWNTDIGTNGKGILPKSDAGKPSGLVPIPQNWEGYKQYVATLEGRRNLFRGQNKQLRLRTSFHRSGRADLFRFLNEDIKVLHKHLIGKTRHFFNLQNADENGAFFNLLQHHGYPTPLLDWSYSPYVAVFFAYRGISNKSADNAKPNEKVRVHVFNQSQWQIDWNQLHMLLTSAPHFSVEEFMSVENLRMIPQQSASTLTNLDDIETYIKSKESNGKTYLSAIDLPVKERRKVMTELNYMGITAGSLFPGLDGACEELRERNFEI